LDCKCLPIPRDESGRYHLRLSSPYLLPVELAHSASFPTHNHPPYARAYLQTSRDAHSQHEEDFTPTLYASKTLLSWSSEIDRLSASGKLVNPTTSTPYTHVSLYAAEMCHAIPSPLQPRCFSVLVCTASTSPSSFIAVTIPVELGDLGYYAAGKNVVVGAYAAVETVYLETDGQGKEIIDWTMGTASDTRGNLPMALQKLGLPGAVVKDVGFFLRWIRRVPEREKENVEL
jgi:hypothetical protein